MAGGHVGTCEAGAARAAMMFRRILEDYEARLLPTPDAGPAFANARGKSEHERFANGTTEFKVRVNGIDAPDGASLEVLVNGFAAGRIVLRAGRGRLLLSSGGSATMPAVGKASRIEVLYATRRVLTGVYAED